MNKAGRQTIYSIQALRGVAFLGVFAFHSGVKCFGGSGAWGVSVFFVLSGFIMTYSYYGSDRINLVSFRNNILFARDKIKRLYLLHFLTTFAMAVFMIVGDTVESVEEIIIKLILNILLIQEWIPMSQRSINGVSWYLCVTAFLYFIFPWILKYMEKGYSGNKAKKMAVGLFLLQILIGGGCLLIILTGHEIDLEWFVYKFPLVRALDFIIGCNMGYLFLKSPQKMIKKAQYTILELVCLFIIIIGNLCHIMESTLYPDRWWTFSIVFTISSCMAVYLFAENKGYITRLLTNKFTIFLGELSPYAFLIHFVIFRYLEAICKILYGKEFALYNKGWINLTIGFVLTILLAWFIAYGKNMFQVQCKK